MQKALKKAQAMDAEAREEARAERSGWAPEPADTDPRWSDD
jgi:hypothetical protein